MFSFSDPMKDEKKINEELVMRVRSMMGPITSFRAAAAITALPKTRSGKIIRKSITTLAQSKQIKVKTNKNIFRFFIFLIFSHILFCRKCKMPQNN
jgi:acyl-coenzyme A synthetase/AMP-(fatty) acid ligase